MAKARARASFTMKDIGADIRRYTERAKGRAVEALDGVARAAAADLRANAVFLNHTHDLRSSLAATVFRDGAAVRGHHGFSDGSGATSGGGLRGIGEGTRVAERETPRNGIGVMLVAGMGYAGYVEDLGHKTVLSGTAPALARAVRRIAGK